jgi:hypothetical protein
MTRKRIIEISVKSGKDSTSILSLVINKVRYKRKKKYISIRSMGVKLSNLMVF